MKTKLALTTLAVLPFLGISANAAGQTGVINYEFVNIRTNPNLDESAKFVLKRGDNVEIISEKDGWTNIKFENKTGWVQSGAIVKNDSVEKNIKTAPTSSKEQTVIKSVNFRQSASTSSNILGVLNVGEKVTVLESSVGWTKIEYKGKVGYVSSQFLGGASSTSSNTVSNSGTIMNVTSNTLNVRKSADAMSERIVELKKGDKVEFISESRGWSKIKADGKVGYVSSYYLKDTGETSGSAEIENTENNDQGSQDVQETAPNPSINKTSQNGQINNVNMGMSLDAHVNLQLSKALNVNSQEGWRHATKDELTYYMNPNNFRDTVGMMQFAVLNQYTDDITASQLNQYLNKYCKPGNVFYNKGQDFINAAKKNNINVLYLVGHSMIETGYGTSKLASGISYNGKTVYNFFGIGAVDGNAVAGGSATAYKNGWTSVAAGIDGAATWISSKYLHNSTYKQKTLYNMKWSIDYTWHQYASDITWPSKIGKKMSDIGAYSSNLSAMNYDVPMYK